MFLLVVAKEPVPGRVKTRLCPPCSPAEAAGLAEAALHDTFAAAVASGATEVIAALDGRAGPWLPEGVRVVQQVPGPFDRRLAAAWSATTGRGLQIGMDTPQLTPDMLDGAMAELDRDHVDAVLGPATDGGWWAIGLGAADDRVFHDVPMSRPDTCRRQRARLLELGLRVRDLATLTDVDHFADVEAVASMAPGSCFAATARAMVLDADW